MNVFSASASGDPLLVDAPDVIPFQVPVPAHDASTRPAFPQNSPIGSVAPCISWIKPFCFARMRTIADPISAVLLSILLRHGSRFRRTYPWGNRVTYEKHADNNRSAAPYSCICHGRFPKPIIYSGMARGMGAVGLRWPGTLLRCKHLPFCL